MGISADQFWSSSQNGKAMIVMAANLEKVELVKDICDWLVVQHGKDATAGAVQNGATLQQAKLIGDGAATGLQPLVDGMNDRNCAHNAAAIVDAVFQRHYAKGKVVYDKTMADFADLLRQRVKD